MNKEIGNRIRTARKEAGLKQKELAEIIGVSESRISQYENGSQRPRVDTIQKIADGLGITPTELLGDSLESIEYEARTEHYSPFLKYLGSLGYQIYADRDSKVFGSGIIHSVNGGYIVTSPSGEETRFTSDQFKEFEKAISDSVDYQIWQQNHKK